MRVRHDVARLEAVLTSLQVRLPDEVNDVAVVECSDDALEERRSLARRLAARECGDRRECKRVRPGLVRREEPRVFTTEHGLRSLR
jgi:hypothetical protein